MSLDLQGYGNTQDESNQSMSPIVSGLFVCLGSICSVDLLVGLGSYHINGVGEADGRVRPRPIARTVLVTLKNWDKLDGCKGFLSFLYCMATNDTTLDI